MASDVIEKIESMAYGRIPFTREDGVDLYVATLDLKHLAAELRDLREYKDVTEKMIDRGKFLLRLNLERSVFHYLRACTSWGANGAAKAENHIFISERIFEYLFCQESGSMNAVVTASIHDVLLPLTDYLDEQIGLPLDTQLFGDEWDEYVEKFIDKVFEMMPEIETSAQAAWSAAKGKE